MGNTSQLTLVTFLFVLLKPSTLYIDRVLVDFLGSLWPLVDI